MAQKFLQVGVILIAIAIILGAFGAHALKSFLIENGKSDTFETAVKYHFYGSFGLMVIGLLPNIYHGKWYNWAGFLQLFGTLIFCISLYLICFTGINLFGAIAPIGGVCMIASWFLVFISIKKPI
jgi:uncharacterized membrane protein YgdD (TMEM256/DUF423 family)